MRATAHWPARRHIANTPAGIRCGIALLAILGPAAHGISAATVFESDLARVTASVLDDLAGVPGLAVAVVRGDEVLVARGFGYRNVEEQLPVTADTGFYIASSTKSFTGLAASLLAQEGALDLDAPLATYFPSVAADSPVRPQQTSLRDLLGQRSGFSNGAINYRLAWTGALPDAELVRLLREHSSAGDRRFRYGNHNFNLVGLILGQVTGSSWQTVLAERIFEPLGMTRTTTRMSEVRESAAGYGYENGSLRRVAAKPDSTMNAAGGIATTAVDAARWLAANVTLGRLDGKQLLPREAVRQAHAPQTTLDRTFYRFHRHAYAFGWYHADYEGDLLVHHFGSYPGFHAHISFMPDHRLAVAVLANAGPNAGRATHLLAAWIYDRLLEKDGLSAKHAAALGELRADIEARETQRASARSALAGQRDPGALVRALHAYVGEYESPRLGTIVISAEGNGVLTACLGVMCGPMTPQAPDDFLVDWIAEALPVPLRFMGEDGRVVRVSWDQRHFERRK